MPEKISLVRKMLENLKKLEESTLVLRYYVWTQKHPLEWVITLYGGTFIIVWVVWKLISIY